jgi:hypothetical protein
MREIGKRYPRITVDHHYMETVLCHLTYARFLGRG